MEAVREADLCGPGSGWGVRVFRGGLCIRLGVLSFQGSQQVPSVWILWDLEPLSTIKLVWGWKPRERVPPGHVENRDAVRPCANMQKEVSFTGPPITDVPTWHVFNKASPVNLVHTYKRTWRCIPLCICDGSGRSESFTGPCRSPAGKPQVQTIAQLLQSKSTNGLL